MKTDHFQVELQSASKTFTGSVESVSGSSALVPGPRPELSLEELVSRTKPAVVFLRSLTKSGTGFFITETGVIATNAHLARGEEALLATLPNGTQLEAKIVYVDPDLTNYPTLQKAGLVIAATQRGVLASARLTARGSQSTEEQTTDSLVLRPAGVRQKERQTKGRAFQRI